MPQPTHKLYLDDSGTKEDEPSGVYTGGGGKTPFFVFGGLLMPVHSARVASSGLKALKLATFGTTAVEIKANWLRIAKERQKRYTGPFGLSDAEVDAFVDEVYALISALDARLVAALVDKAAVQKRYKKPWYAPAIAYECLLQRTQMEMSKCSGLLHVTIDDMSGATPKGNQYRDNLVKHHARLLTHGSTLQRGMKFDRLAGQRFSDSKADERLQLADLVAYCVYKQFVDHGPDWDSNAPRIPAYMYLAKIIDKFCRNDRGVVAGYGIVKFPLVAGRKSWGKTTT